MDDSWPQPAQYLFPAAELCLLPPLFDANSFLDGIEEGAVKIAMFALAEGLFEFSDDVAAFWVVLQEVVQVL